MSKILKISFPKKCTGCELCLMEAQRQLGRAGLDGSPIRIFRNSENGLSFEIDLDPVVNELDIKKISEACPETVFTVEDLEGRENYGLVGSGD